MILTLLPQKLYSCLQCYWGPECLYSCAIITVSSLLAVTMFYLFDDIHSIYCWKFSASSLCWIIYKSSPSQAKDGNSFLCYVRGQEINFFFHNGYIYIYTYVDAIAGMCLCSNIFFFFKCQQIDEFYVGVRDMDEMSLSVVSSWWLN